MPAPKELARNPDGSWKRNPAPLSRQNGRHRDRLAAAKAAIQHADRDDDTPLKQTRDPAKQPAENRRSVAKTRLEAHGSVDSEIDRLQQRFGLSDEFLTDVLKAAVEYDGPNALADGMIDAARDHGDHELAQQVADLYGLELGADDGRGDPTREAVLAEVECLEQAGMHPDDVTEIVQLAASQLPVPGGVIVAAAAVALEFGDDGLVDRIADALDVDAGVLEDQAGQALDEVLDLGDLELADPDAQADEPDDAQADDDDDEHDSDADGHADDVDVASWVPDPANDSNPANGDAHAAAGGSE